MMRARPLSLKGANALVSLLHRHHKRVQGHKFSIGCEVDGVMIGCVIVGRPVARMVNHRHVAEVTRLVTTGEKNACSFLYACAARAARAMGYERIQTYILEEELGTSVQASGWRFDGMTSGGDWNHSKKNVGTRRTDQPMGKKQRWVKDL